MAVAASEPEPDSPKWLEVRDAHIMRAMAHPARFKIMEHLLRGRSGTATELAVLCGLSPSATSYHLRELAKAGLIREAVGRGDGRERVWESPDRGLSVAAGPTASPDEQEAERALVSAMLTVGEARVRQWLDRRLTEPVEWYDVTALGEANVVVTPDELAAINDAMIAIVEPYRNRDAAELPEGAREVWITYRSIPKPLPD